MPRGSPQPARDDGRDALAREHPGLPAARAGRPAQTLDALGVEGRPLESLRLLGLAEFLDSIDATRNTIRRLPGSIPLLGALADSAASFKNEIADVRRKIDPAARSWTTQVRRSPGFASGCDASARGCGRTLDALVRGRDTAKYLQEQVVTDRNGRYVLMVKAEHRLRFRASSTARRPAAPRSSWSRSKRSKSTTTW